jgi:O-acetyl-ADP-ribose deacetylase (regulator of RNase III)
MTATAAAGKGAMMGTGYGLKTVLVAQSPELAAAWRAECAGLYGISVILGDIFTVAADAMVSPANSFGIMDGGLDGKIRDFFGPGIEEALRSRIRAEWPGELPVGCAIVTPTGDSRIPFLVSAPTMRVPSEQSDSINAYLAMKAALHAALVEPRIRVLSVPGLCSLTGRMPLPMVARQMRAAWERVMLKLPDYRHWREERAYEDYLRCRSPFIPDDLERK